MYSEPDPIPALVLGAQVNPDGTPSASLRRRALHASRLWHAGLAGPLILSGGAVTGPVSEAEVMAYLCRETGVPQVALILDTRARSTRENIDNALDVLRRMGSRRVLIVTDGWHMPRAMLAARQRGLKPIAAACPPGGGRLARMRLKLREIPAWLSYRLRG